jgi:hypothetical protein
MPSAQIARLPAFIGRPKQSAISISPDSFQAWPFSRAQTTALALEPPSPEFINHMVRLGASLKGFEHGMSAIGCKHCWQHHVWQTVLVLLE